MIELIDVSKQFGDKVAVRDLNLKVGGGELYAFLGPNGAGKTTTIKLLVGLLTPTAGRVLVGGVDMNQNPVAAKRLIGYVPDQPYLYEKLTGREFLGFIARIYGVEAGEEKIEQAIRTFGMQGYIDLLIESYSHGMKQKVVFSAALIHEPRLLVVDEPTVGLDPASVRLLKQVLREQVGRGATAFVSTHVLSFAEDVADRVGIISRGTLIAEGTIPELRRRAGAERRLEDVFLEITREAGS